MSGDDSLAEAVGGIAPLLTRYLAGFDDSNATKQAPGLPNHALWSLGHLALYNHRAAEKILDRTIDLTWDPEPFAFNSQPVGDRATYPPLTEMVKRYEASVALLADAARQAGREGLNRQVTWGRGVPATARELLLRMIFHNGTHCGQIIDLRRALGLPRVIQ
jgi:hypothetical protein